MLSCAATHLPSALASLAFLPQSSLNALVPSFVRSALHRRDGFSFVWPPPPPAVLGSRYVLSFTLALRTRMVCSLSVNAFGFPTQLASTTIEILSTACEPSRVSAAAHVEHT